MDVPASDRFIATTTLGVEGYRIAEYLGVVRGVVVRSPTISQGFFGGLRTIVAGQIHEYTQMCEQARQQATHQMIHHARELGANGVVGHRLRRLGDRRARHGGALLRDRGAARAQRLTAGRRPNRGGGQLPKLTATATPRGSPCRRP